MSHLIPGTTTSGQVLSPSQIYQLAVQAGFSATDAVKATAIALAESGGRTNIANDTTNAAGIWQIFTGDASTQTLAFQQQMADPVANAAAAVAKYKDSLKTQCGGWWPWASYDEGPCAARHEKGRDNSYLTYMQQAQAAATGVDIAGGAGSLVSGGGTGGNVAPATPGSAGGATLTLFRIPNPFGEPFQFQVPIGALWAVLFFGGAIALVLLGILLYAKAELPSVSVRA